MSQFSEDFAASAAVDLLEVHGSDVLLLVNGETSRKRTIVVMQSQEQPRRVTTHGRRLGTLPSASTGHVGADVDELPLRGQSAGEVEPVTGQ